MKFIVIALDEPSHTVTLTEPDPIMVDVGQVQIRTGDSGSGTATSSRVFNFTNADLAANGSITFTHNLDLTFVDVSVYSPELGEVFADSVSTAYNSVTINLFNFMPITGLWTILIEV